MKDSKRSMKGDVSVEHIESRIAICEGFLKEYIETENVLAIRATEIILDDLRKMLEEV